jgi:hypothetical protein
MVKTETLQRYTKILNEVIERGISVGQYYKERECKPSAFYIFLKNVRKYAEKGEESCLDFLELYDKASFLNNYSGYEECGMRMWFDRDDDGIISSYHVHYPRKDEIDFDATLTRRDVETLYGLYTYYGGNVTARNVANEFPMYTLPEVKMMFRCFGITKDSIWCPPHLVEELNEEQLAQYRMSLKERAAFKYADAQSERDFTNQIKKMASEINKLTSYKDVAKELIDTKFEVPELPVIDTTVYNKTGIICLSDLHIGAFNVTGGYIPLPEYTEEEINRRLDFVIKSIANKNWSRVIVLNLGDNIDSYQKLTTSMTHALPGIMTDKEIAMMYLRVMTRFFTQLKKYISNVAYYSIGDGNHSGAAGWLNDLVLCQHLKEYNIDTYVSNNAIDTFEVSGVSFIFLHGKAAADKSQYKGFPLNLDIKTENWFNNFFYDTPLKLNKRKVVLKGDLHQFSINNCTTFDYINCPSIYGSSTYIVSNFGYTKWGCAYLEVESNGNYTTGLIKE